MHVLPPDVAGGPAGVSRRAFLGCCSALLAASSGCATLSPHTRSAYALMTDPPLEQYQPVLDRLIESILPDRDVNFPVAPEQLRSRVLTLFPLDSDTRFLGMQKALVLFDQIDLFRHPLRPVLQEQVSRGASAGGLDATQALARSHTHDAALYTAFAGQHAALRFTSLSLDGRRAYFDLWRASGYLIRRQFYASARSLVLIAAYSMDAVWPAIDYHGPLVRGRPS